MVCSTYQHSPPQQQLQFPQPRHHEPPPRHKSGSQPPPPPNLSVARQSHCCCRFGRFRMQVCPLLVSQCNHQFRGFLYAKCSQFFSLRTSFGLPLMPLKLWRHGLISAGDKWSSCSWTLRGSVMRRRGRGSRHWQGACHMRQRQLISGLVSACGAGTASDNVPNACVGCGSAAIDDVAAWGSPQWVGGKWLHSPCRMVGPQRGEAAKGCTTPAAQE